MLHENYFINQQRIKALQCQHQLNNPPKGFRDSIIIDDEMNHEKEEIYKRIAITLINPSLTSTTSGTSSITSSDSSTNSNFKTKNNRNSINHYGSELLTTGSPSILTNESSTIPSSTTTSSFNSSFSESTPQNHILPPPSFYCSSHQNENVDKEMDSNCAQFQFFFNNEAEDSTRI
jgi:hypothetical protein